MGLRLLDNKTVLDLGAVVLVVVLHLHMVLLKMVMAVTEMATAAVVHNNHQVLMAHLALVLKTVKEALEAEDPRTVMEHPVKVETADQVVVDLLEDHLNLTGYQALDNQVKADNRMEEDQAADDLLIHTVLPVEANQDNLLLPTCLLDNKEVVEVQDRKAVVRVVSAEDQVED